MSMVIDFPGPDLEPDNVKTPEAYVVIFHDLIGDKQALAAQAVNHVEIRASGVLDTYMQTDHSGLVRDLSFAPSGWHMVQMASDFEFAKERADLFNRMALSAMRPTRGATEDPIATAVRKLEAFGPERIQKALDELSTKTPDELAEMLRKSGVTV